MNLIEALAEIPQIIHTLLFEGFSMFFHEINHPAIEVPPWLWKASSLPQVEVS